MSMDDPVKILNLVQVVCDDCGWHTASVEADDAGRSASREWARLHRATCPFIGPHGALEEIA